MCVESCSLEAARIQVQAHPPALCLYTPCSPFLWPPSQITTILMAEDSTHLFSSGCGGPKSEIGLTGLKLRHGQRDFPVVQGLRLQASIVRGRGSVSGWGTKILHALRRGQKNKKMWAGLVLPEAPGENPFPCLFSSWRLPAFLGLWPLHPQSATSPQPLLLPSHRPLLLCGQISPCLPLRTLVITLCVCVLSCFRRVRL